MAHRAYLKEHEGRRYRVAVTQSTINSSKWEQDYRDEKYNSEINMIEINPDEIVGELDEHSKINPNKSSFKEERGIWTELAIKKMKDESANFSKYNHDGKSKHIHLKANRAATPEEKAAILRYYFPEASWEFIDTSLCSNHLIAVPDAKHWKYGTIKTLEEENKGSIINVDDEKFKPYIEIKEVKEFEGQKTSGVTAEIVKNIKITDLAIEFGAVKGKSTDNYHCCFHHPDKDPSLSLDDKRGWYNCFGCGRSGNIVDFLSEAEHISKEEAVKRLIERAGISNNNIDFKEKINPMPEISNRIENINLNPTNKREETLKALRQLIKLDSLETEEALEQLQKKTGYKMGVLRKILDGFRASEYNSQKIAKKINSDKIQYDKSDLKRIVLMHLLKGEIEHATEILCQEIQDKEDIYTTRDDEKSEVWIYQEGIYIPNGKTYIKEFCRLILEESYTSYLANLVISKIETDTYIEAKEFFKESPVEEIPVKNGILNIFTKTLSPFTPEKRFFTKIPINHIPLADCPLIKKFLSQIHKHENDVLIIQELFGYCLLRDYRIEKAFMLTGDGRNGKGRELEILKRFLGPESCVNIQLQDIEKDNFALSEFHGKLANISGDISKEAIAFSGNFKMLTGMDMLTANRKFKVRISFLNYAKQIYSANEIPKTYDLTDAFFSRWVLLEFPYKFLSQKELDKLSEEERSIKINDRPKYNLADKEVVVKITTEEELTGLLNWALEGLARLLQQRDFSYSKSMAEVKDMWIRKSDSFQAFCKDEIEQQYDSIITKDELRKKYNDYCKKHNVIAVGDRAIKETLNREYGVTDSQRTVFINNNTNEKKVSYIWEGIKFKNETPN